ncbi:HNH endonuclease [Brevibacillus laterosporus]|uniref:HNH endonuclease n=1 Tax=Brevibacillus laterosporus TaxID=1465 RepID=UPI000C787806|nr:HNH endonuclease [Brevibacillus laterosporus]AUM66407.1 Fis family transcriptional regulator [Brevibacillus laterosporus]AYK07741.1 Fis family transcriptional regulator [Brevibacillus laterosporus]
MAREITLTKGKVAIVDDLDYKSLSRYKWHYVSSGYAGRSIHHKGTGAKSFILMHRKIVKAPVGKVVDHINGNKLDNRRSNLRIVDQTKNQANRQHLNRNNKSGFRGVSWSKAAEKWESCVMYLGKKIYLGIYESPVDAAIAYNTKASELFGDCAQLNNIPKEDDALSHN